MTSRQKITTCLWFDGNAEEESTIQEPSMPLGQPAGMPFRDISCRPAIAHDQAIFGGGSIANVARGLEQAGQHFIALDGGPQNAFAEAISLSLDCVDQAEVKHYRDRLSAGGPNLAAAGRRTSTACRGRSCRGACRNCCPARMPRSRPAS